MTNAMTQTSAMDLRALSIDEIDDVAGGKTTGFSFRLFGYEFTSTTTTGGGVTETTTCVFNPKGGGQCTTTTKF